MGGGENELIIKSILDNTGFTKGSKQLMSAIKGLSSSIKSMFGRIVGAASIFGVLSKAVSTFMSQNQELSKQLNAAWTALGNALGPIITQIVNWVTQAVSYLVTLMKLLGFTSKTASQASKAAKAAGGSLQRTVAGFDELTKLSAGGGGGGAGTLKDVDPDVFMEKLAELLKNHLWEEAGRLLADKVNGIIENIDFAGIAKKLSDGLKGVLEFLIGFIDELDFKQIGAKIRDFFTNIDWEGIRDRIFELLKTAWNAAIDLLWGLIAGDSEVEPPIVGALRQFGNALIDFVGKLSELVSALSPAWDWVYRNIIEPVLRGVLDDATRIVQSLTKSIDALIKLINGEITFKEFVGEIDGITVAVIALSSAVAVSKFLTWLGGISGPASAATGSVSTLASAFGTLASAIGTGGAFATAGLAAVGVLTLLDEVVTVNKIGYAEAGLSAEEYAQNLANLTAEAEREKKEFDELALHSSELTMAQNELDHANIAVGNATKQLADSLGITTEELKRQIEAAGGDVTKIEALKNASDGLSESNADVASSQAEATKAMDVYGSHVEGAARSAGNAAQDFIDANREMSGAAEDTASQTGISYGKVEDAVSGHMDYAASEATSASAGIRDEVGGDFDQLAFEVAGSMSDVSVTVNSEFSNLASQSSRWGTDLIANFVNGIRAAIPYLANNMAMVAQIVRNYLGFSEPKEGPLSDFHTYGPDMMELYAQGIEGSSGKVLAAVSEVAEGVADGLNGNPASISAVASGAVVPYGVAGMSASESKSTDLGAVVNELSGLINDFRESIENMQVVAQFGDFRLIAQKITTMQKQMERANG